MDRQAQRPPGIVCSDPNVTFKENLEETKHEQDRREQSGRCEPAPFPRCIQTRKVWPKENEKTRYRQRSQQRQRQVLQRFKEFSGVHRGIQPIGQSNLARPLMVVQFNGDARRAGQF